MPNFPAATPFYECEYCGTSVHRSTDNLIREVSGVPHSCPPRTEYPPSPDDVDVPFEAPRTPDPRQREVPYPRIEDYARMMYREPTFNITAAESSEEGVPDLPDIQPGTWWSVPLPEGIAWSRYPSDDGTPGVLYCDPHQVVEYPARIAALRAWASEHGFVVNILRRAELYLAPNYTMVPSRFRVSNAYETQDEFDAAYPPEGSLERDFDCPLCGGTHLAYTNACQGRYLSCSSCGRGVYHTRDNEARELSFYESPDGGDYGLICSVCSHPCDREGCEETVEGAFEFCYDHGQRAQCGCCGNRLEAPIEDEEPWRSSVAYEVVCESCASMLCEHCGRYNDNPPVFSGELDAYVCRRCFREAMAGSGEEEFDSSATMSVRSMRIPTIPGRENIRLCGVEIEGGNGEGDGTTLAQAFYDLGLSEINVMAGYHHGSRSGFAHVERDSSVDWEAVIGPLNPAVREDVSRLNRAVRTLRDLVKDGTLKLDLRGGCHIHIEAARVSLDGSFNLNTLFAYIEDVMFRLGAAKWPIHRAIQGSDYARPIPKDVRKLQFARIHGDRDDARYYALSFDNYFRQMLGSCNCGAVRYDSWEDCTCNLGKCTFEFRVFNTTANPRKLHAYLALTQALVAKALKLGTIDDPATEFPALTFEPKRYKDMDPDAQGFLAEEWRERLEWIFTDLPLTDDERASVLYCVRNSELVNVGDDFINNLIPAASEQQVIEEVAA